MVLLIGGGIFAGLNNASRPHKCDPNLFADGVEMPLEEGTSAFITMNPGYIGRAGEEGKPITFKLTMPDCTTQATFTSRTWLGSSFHVP